MMVVFGWRRAVDFLTNRPVMALLWTLRVRVGFLGILGTPPLFSELLLSKPEMISTHPGVRISVYVG